jgi:SpoVK/Ycf46/Vps4 family AAA+-type ATPase
VKDKNKEGGSSSAEVTNYLLDSMDGNLKVSNCKVFGTTNYVNAIEKAILRRFNLFYLGYFDSNSRLKWI